MPSSQGLASRLARSLWPPRRGLFIALAITAFAAWCLVLVAPHGELHAQLDIRRAWFKELNGVQCSLHEALGSDLASIHEAVNESTKSLDRVGQHAAGDSTILPEFADSLGRTRAWLTAVGQQNETCTVETKPVAPALLEALQGVDHLVELARRDIQRVNGSIVANRDKLQIGIMVALALACFTLFLMYRHASSRKRVAELTASRALDAKIHDARRLESLGLLAGGVAHDFNNLLVGILANAELAARFVPEGSQAGECVEEISSTARRCAELSRQMLGYCGRGRLRVTEVDLNAVVEEVCEELRTTHGAQCALRFRLAVDLPAIEGDALRIRQAVTHVVANACEAIGPAGGTVTVSTAMRSLDRAKLEHFVGPEVLAEGSYACIEVTDDGCGMDAHILARVFDPFFTTKSVNRGFGLAVVFGVVRAHRGSVAVESEPGRGTTVRILLPERGAGAGADLAELAYRAPGEAGADRRATG